MKPSFFIILAIAIGVASFNPNQASETALVEGSATIVHALPVPVSLPSEAGAGAMAARLSNNGTSLILSWLTPVNGLTPTLKGTASQLVWSSWDGHAWSKPQTVIQSSHMFANWADRPSVFRLSDQRFYAHWLDKAGDTVYGYNIALASTDDGGERWQSLGSIWRPDQTNRKTYDGFVSMVREGKGVRAFWIDGRLYDKEAGGAMRLMTAFIDKSVQNETVLDGSICSCCDTTAVTTDDGPVVLYRGRSNEEIRDILVVRKTNDGWSRPRPVANERWHITGCPVNGPTAAARGKRLVLAWFTGATGLGSVRVAFSDDAGRTFDTPIEVDTVSPQGPIGRVGVVLLDHGEAVVSWLGRSDVDNRALLFLRRVARDGRAGRYLKLSQIEGERSVGVPQLAALANALYVVWSLPNANAVGQTPHEKTRGLHMVRLERHQIPRVMR